MMTRRKGKCKMKMRITKKTIRNSYKNVIRVGYCELERALTWREPNFYTAGVYGWNADIYVISDETVIVTGYRPFGNTELPRNVVDTLNACAESVKRYSKYEIIRILLKNNLDELARGIEYDLNSYVFESATEKFEIKRK